MEEKEKQMIFALDIGTRSVVGLVAEGTEDEGLKIVACEMEEHRNRAMLDGQIHDVVQVAEVVKRVKLALEKKVEMPLTEVAVAAAGRALRTQRAKAVHEISPLEEISSENVLALELEGVQNAMRELVEMGETDGYDYHCVGYSVMGYKLEGQKIISLVGQRGSQIEVELIATFLPRVVVDSLFAVLQRGDMEMKNLTLEPIAAINVVIPPNMRQLNLALVDVGAGTSDIAITAGGTIIAYDMVPVAGDEVTEALSQKYLLDFNTAETVKRSLVDRDDVEFMDILGWTHTVPVHEPLSVIESTVGNLARQIADKILTLNEKAPQAALLIGGGSLTPLLAEKLAENVGLSRERVAVRGREMLPGLSGNLKRLSGPEFVTPIGIAVTALRHQTLGFYNVQVNNQVVRLFNLHKGTVADALLAAGVNIKKLHGRPGMALSVEVNGQLKIIRGTMGKSATISVNGRPARLDTPVKPKDKIQFTEATNGEDARGTIANVVPAMEPLPLYFQGREIVLYPRITMNGSLVDSSTELVDGAKISVQDWKTVGEVLDFLEEDGALTGDQVLKYSLNGTAKTVTISTGVILLNSRAVDRNHMIAPRDRIDVEVAKVSGLKVKEVIDVNRLDGAVLNIVLNGIPQEVPGERARLFVNGKPATGNEYIAEGDAIEFRAGRRPDYILSELLSRLGFDPTPPPGKSRLLIRMNGMQAEYTTPVNDGARVDLIWE